MITVNKTKYLYTTQFDKYVNYIQNGQNARRRLFGSDTEPFTLQKLYDPIFILDRIVFFDINKMFFCEKVQLLHEEWAGGYQGIWLHLTGSGNDTFLGDAEIDVERDENTWKFQIYVQDFLSQFESTKNTAHQSGIIRYLLVFINIIMFSVRL